MFKSVFRKKFNRMYRLSIIALCVIITVMLAGCGGQGGGGANTTAAATAAAETTTAAAATTTTTAAKAETTTEAKAEKEQYNIKILRGATDFTFSDLTEVGKVIKDKFNIVFEFIPYTGDMREKQNLMLASGDYNEIQYMQRDDIVTSYIGAGALLDLEQFKDIMPNFWARYGEKQIPYWRLVGKGKLYKWETSVPRYGDMDIETNDLHVRIDVLEKYGWPNPVSTSQWIELLQKAVKDFPETDGQPTVGVTACLGEPWGLQGTMPILYEKSDTYLPLSNEGYTYNIKTGQFEDYFQNKYVKESFQFFNRLYREGLLDEECFTDKNDRTIEKAKAGIPLSIWYTGPGNNNAIPLERQYLNMPVQSDTMVAEGQKRLIRKETTRNFDSYGITKNAVHPERIAELVDWAMSDEGQITLRSGVEGIHWERDSTGKRVMTESRKKAAIERDPKWNLTQGLNTYNYLGSFNIKAADGQFPDLFSHAEINDEFGLTERQKEALRGLGWKNSKSWYISNMEYGETGLAGAIYVDSTTDLGKIHQQMTEVRLKWSAKMIMAKDDAEFENIYKQAMEEYDKLNHKSVIDEYNRLLAEAMAQLG